MYETLEQIAEYVIWQLKSAGFRIQRYDSVTTSSIYLKLDYGVCNSIRISDHKGKKGLRYRYNLLKNRSKVNTHHESGVPRNYYGFQHVESMLDTIINDRSDKFLMYGAGWYKAKMVDSRIKNNQAKGFWSQCYEVN